MNTAPVSESEVHYLSRRCFLPFCLQTYYGHERAFQLSFASLAHFAGLYPHRCRRSPRRGAWVPAQGFAFLSQAHPCHPTESSSLRGPLGTPALRTGISFPVALHGRAFPAAVSFHYRLVDLRLTGTCTPLRCYLHSRTMSSLTGFGTRWKAASASANRMRV